MYDKLKWIKENDVSLCKTLLADKYFAKEVVRYLIDVELSKKKIKNDVLGSQLTGADYVIPLLGVYSNASEIPFESLPLPYVLKCCHGSHYNRSIINESYLEDVESIREKFDCWMLDDFYARDAEYQYKGIPKRIIAEEYKLIHNVYVWCAGGKPLFLMLIHVVDGVKYHTVFNMNNERVDVTFTKKEAYKGDFNKLEPTFAFDKLKWVASTLCKTFKFVRCDLYWVRKNNEVFFGEMTFTPFGMRVEIRPPEVEKFFLSCIRIP